MDSTFSVKCKKEGERERIFHLFSAFLLSFLHFAFEAREQSRKKDLFRKSEGISGGQAGRHSKNALSL